MEIRIENTIKVKEIEELKEKLDNQFNTDFVVHIDGDYVYYRDLQ